MNRRHFVVSLTAVSVAPALAQDASADDRALSAEWTAKSQDFVTQLQAGIARGDAKLPRQPNTELARRVLARVRALHEQGWDARRVRELFPLENDAILRVLGDDATRVFNVGFVGDAWFFLAGDFRDTPRIYLVTGDRIDRVEAGAIPAIGISRDGRSMAVLRNDGSIALKPADFKSGATHLLWLPRSFVINGKTIAAYRDANEVQRLLPLNDGKGVLVAGLRGNFLVTEEGARLLDQVSDDSTQLSAGGPLFTDMAHVDISADELWIAVGSQDSSHSVLDRNQHRVATIDPGSSYPHCAIFNDRIQQVAFNSCHFYSGVTLGVDYAAFQKGTELTAGEPRVVTLDEDDRVYAGVAWRDGYIWGSAYGYLRHVDRTGKTVWRHFVGGTITSMALSADATKLAVGTYGGVATLVDLASANSNARAIGTAGFNEPVRFVASAGSLEPVRW